MLKGLGRLSLLAAWASLGWCGPSRAQPSDSAPPPPAAKPPAETVTEAKPEVYYLKDKDGNLHPVPGFTLEKFEQLRRAAEGMAQQQPSYRLERISATGVANPDHAELSMRFTVFVGDENWVRVPLRLGTAVLRDQTRYEGPGEHFLEFEEANQAYVVWLRGKSEQPHHVTLQVIVPLESLAGQSRLELNAPRAAASELLLRVPSDRIVGQVSAGAMLDSTQVVDGATEFKVLGLSSDFALSWRDAGSGVVEAPAVIEAIGAIVVRIDGHSANTDAKLTVRSFGGEFDSFHVRLPRGATLVTADQPEYSVKLLAESSVPASPPADAPLAEVRWKQKTVGPVSVRLVTQQVHDGGASDEWLTLGGFEVPGAFRQWGHIAVEVTSDWQVSWGEPQRVRQVEDLPTELARDGLLAGFAYFAQPYSLPARIAPRKTRVNLEPQYLVMAGPDQLQLEAKLKYRVHGAKAFALGFDLAEWQLDEVGPPDLVDVDALAPGAVGPVSIPLVRPSAGELELTVRAHRAIPGDATSVEFSLPRPQADVLAPAALMVLPADNIELTPREDEIQGLSRQPARPEMPLPPRQQAPWFYRSEAAAARFCAFFRVHSRRIKVDVRSQLTLERVGGRGEQTLAYQIDHESVDELWLDVPRILAEKGELAVTLDDRPLPVGAADEKPPDPRQPLRLRVALPDKRIGACELTVRYRLPRGKPIPPAATSLRVPLVMPAEGELSANTLSVVAGAGIKLERADDPWIEQQDAGEGPTPGALRLAAGAFLPEVVLRVRREERRALDATVVERAWIQTRFTDVARHDRIVYRFTSRGDQLALELPPGVLGAEVSLDGKAVAAPEGRSANELLVSWPASSSTPRRHVLEVRYRYPDRGPRPGPLSIQWPQLRLDVEVRRTYWQLVLPRDEHLVAGPRGFTPEFSWSWNDYYWGRRPLLEQAELEAWGGVPHDTPLPQATNRYLFSTTDTAGTLEVRTLSRSVVVLAASGSVLALGLLLIYVPRIRHPALVFIVAVGLLTAGSLFPEPTLLVMQAGGLGVVLVVVAGWLERGVSRRHKRPLSLRGGSNSIIGRSSTQTYPRVVAEESQSARQIAGAVGQLPAPESMP